MTEPEPSPTGKDHRLGHVQKRVRERERNRLRARLRVQHRCEEGRCSRVVAAAARRVQRGARFAPSGFRPRRVVVVATSVVTVCVCVLMAVVVGDLGVGVRLRGV